jgi:hypothetical protein
MLNPHVRSATCGDCNALLPAGKPRLFVARHWYCPACLYRREYPGATERSLAPSATRGRMRVEQPTLFAIDGFIRREVRRSTNRQRRPTTRPNLSQ